MRIAWAGVMVCLGACVGAQDTPTYIYLDDTSLEHITTIEDQAAVLYEKRRRCEEKMREEEERELRRLGVKADAKTAGGVEGGGGGGEGEKGEAGEGIKDADDGGKESEVHKNVTDTNKWDHSRTFDSIENVIEIENVLRETQENSTVFCATTFDDVYCWPRTAANTVITIPCPQYIQGFKNMSQASRYCTMAGSWYRLSGTNKSWTNYTQCSPTALAHDPQHLNLLLTWTPVVRAMSCVGYSVSLATLVVAFSVLACIKRLRCPRNTLHMHLFFSFICRAVGALLRGEYGLVVQEPLVDSGTWGCRVFTSFWQYFILANYAWILMEGLYLHNLIFLALFTDNSAITLYIVLGWGLPLVLVLGWVVARLMVENVLCWLTNTRPWVFWTFIRGPITVSILVSFALFINIARELLLKIRSSTTPESRKYRYRRWARSTLVLVPLFGVHYAALIGFTSFMGRHHTIELIWLFTDQLFASFQGFFVATLYCLLNAEVRSELRKIWYHWRMNQDSEKSGIFHSAFSHSRSYLRGGGSWLNQSRRKEGEEGGEGEGRGTSLCLLTSNAKINGGPVSSNAMSDHRNSSRDNLRNQSLTTSLAVVELQPTHCDDEDDDDDDDEVVTETMTAGDTNWYPSGPGETSGRLECSLILHPLSHGAPEPSSPAAPDTPVILNPTDDANGSDSALSDLPPPSTILYHTTESCEGSPLLANPRTAESIF